MQQLQQRPQLPVTGRRVPFHWTARMAVAPGGADDEGGGVILHAEAAQADADEFVARVDFKGNGVLPLVCGEADGAALLRQGGTEVVAQSTSLR